MPRLLRGISARSITSETCDDRQLLDVVDRLPDMFDEPFADSSAIPTYIVSKAAREHVTVALSGDGGDELFLGYPRYRFHADTAWVLALPRPVRRTAALGAACLPTRRLRRIADVLRNDDADRYARFVTWWSPAEVAGDDGQPAGRRARSTRTRWHDRAGCLVESLAGTPRSRLVPAGRHSHQGRSRVHGRQPRSARAAARPSSGRIGAGSPDRLQAPPGIDEMDPASAAVQARSAARWSTVRRWDLACRSADWLRGPLRDRMEDYCAGTDLEELGIDPQPVRLLWREFRDGRSHRTDLLWLIFALVAWSRRFRAAAVPVLDC